LEAQNKFSMKDTPKNKSQLGRPVTGKERKQVITATVDAPLLRELNEIARRKKESRSSVINRLLKKVLGLKE